MDTRGFEINNLLKNKSVLIMSENMDLHGIAVKWAIESLGFSTTWWQRSLFPIDDEISVSLNCKDIDLRNKQSEITFEPNQYLSIWNRRGGSPKISKRLHDADTNTAFSESAFLLSGVVDCITNQNEGALVVNSPTIRRRADEKLLQLYLARQLGLKIPKTLISNSQKDVSKFFHENNNSIVAKSQIPAVWTQADGVRNFLFTSNVEEDHILNAESIAASPMIFQESLDIDFEVRVILFGHNIFCIKRTPIERTRRQVAAVDIKCFDVRSEKYELDGVLREKLFKYLKLLGLAYAAIDIAVCKNGNHYFLEVNESGQFLFLESEIPDMSILDAFAKFLISGDPAFEYDDSQIDVRFKNFMLTEEGVSFAEAYEENLAKGLLPNPFEIVE